jgi:hypothetical protein
MMSLQMIPAFGLNDQLMLLLVFAVFGLIRYFMSLKKTGADQEEHAPDDAEQQRRTREIQEEIRLRIAQNQGRQSSPASAPVQPVARPVAAQAPQTSMRQENGVRPSARRESADVTLSRNVDIMERLAAAKKMEADSRLRAAEALAGLKMKQIQLVAEASAAREGVLAMLDHQQSLRDAFILSEVLSQPVSMRTGGGCPGMMQ